MENARFTHEEGVSVVFHKKNNKGTVVSLQLDDFMNIIKCINYGELQDFTRERKK